MSDLEAVLFGMALGWALNYALTRTLDAVIAWASGGRVGLLDLVSAEKGRSGVLGFGIMIGVPWAAVPSASWDLWSFVWGTWGPGGDWWAGWRPPRRYDEGGEDDRG